MPRKSAGLLGYREVAGTTEVLLVHPGGPFWVKKDDRAWSIPKGEFFEDENPFEAAKREFHEETSVLVTGEFLALQPLTQPSGKVVYVWAVRGDVKAAALQSNTFAMEWPCGSGRMHEFPEVDRADWFTIELARRKIQQGQVGFLDKLEENVAKDGPRPRGDSGGAERVVSGADRPWQGALFDT